MPTPLWLQHLGWLIGPQWAQGYQALQAGNLNYGVQAANFAQDLAVRAMLQNSPMLQNLMGGIIPQGVAGGGGGVGTNLAAQGPTPGTYASPYGAGAVPSPTTGVAPGAGMDVPGMGASTGMISGVPSAQALGGVGGGASTGVGAALGPYGALAGAVLQGAGGGGGPDESKPGALPQAPPPRSTVMPGATMQGGAPPPTDPIFSSGGNVAGFNLPPIVPTQAHAQMAATYTPYLQYLFNTQLQRAMFSGGMGGMGPGGGNLTGVHIHPFNPMATTYDYGPGEVREVPAGAGQVLGGQGGGGGGGGGPSVGGVGGGGGGGVGGITIPTIPGTGLDMGGGGAPPTAVAPARTVGPAAPPPAVPGAPGGGGGGGGGYTPGPRPSRGTGAYANDPDLARARKIVFPGKDQGGAVTPAPGEPSAGGGGGPMATSAPGGALPYGLKYVEKPEEQDAAFRSFMDLAAQADDQVGPEQNPYRQAYQQWGSVKQAMAKGDPRLAKAVRDDIANFDENTKKRLEEAKKLESHLLDFDAKADILESTLGNPKLEQGMRQNMFHVAQSATPGGPITGADIRAGLGAATKASVLGPVYKFGAGGTGKGATGTAYQEMLKQDVMKQVQALSAQLEGIPRITTAELHAFGGPLRDIADNKVPFEKGVATLQALHDEVERMRTILHAQYGRYMQATRR